MDEEFFKLENYKITLEGLVVRVSVYLDEEGMGHYDINILNVSKVTNLILQKIREEFISKMNVGVFDASGEGTEEEIKKIFEKEILFLIHKYFPKTDKKTTDLLVNYLIRQNIGLGDIDIFLSDDNLEEIVINSANEPVRVYHKKHGWLETNVFMPNEAKIRHYSTMVGRDVGKEITVLKPLMDAHLKTGHRVNATLMPISSRGNTITIRKFSSKPWTITDFINANTIDYHASAIVWHAIENELPIIIVGGTGSGKTSMLNVISNFYPPNQRIISIEDTRELTLPANLHWIPMETRLPNPEGQGGISMLDLVVNSLRMRPDRIVMGEIRRKAEAEVLFEAMNTGHSVYGTFHANNVKEFMHRITNPPIEIPKVVLSSIGLIVVQFRNRRSNKRRTLQIAEMSEDSEPNIVMQYNAKTDKLDKIRPLSTFYDKVGLLTGRSPSEIDAEINEKIKLLKWITLKQINDVDKIGSILSKYYARKILNSFKDSLTKKSDDHKAEKELEISQKKSEIDKPVDQGSKDSVPVQTKITGKPDNASPETSTQKENKISTQKDNKNKLIRKK
ncbi:Flp pilus assembly complex ATPase component TadA [Candidatus Woesearchaeota archaeon]|nr:Flp pilus assembly complex ATPase component TadA [Candidatus Woesearchaeota archaeon]